MNLCQTIHNLQTLDLGRGFFNLQTLCDALRKDLNEEELRIVYDSGLWEEHELVQALYALRCQERGLPFPPLKLTPTDEGALPLFGRGFFPWGALPYPREHAEIGHACFQLGHHEVAKGIAQWQQQMTLDHFGNPLFSLFSQDRGLRYIELQEANYSLFESLSLEEPPKGCFTDSTHGILTFRDEETTIQSIASGCKSGMGVFLFRDAGILNFGPQSTPIGESQGFGLAGRPLHFTLNEQKLSYQTRLAAPHTRETGFCGLKDSGYSGLWLQSEQTLSKDELIVSCQFQGMRALKKMKFLFFGKGKSCAVAGTHKLSPRSLDRYQGPSQPLIFQGERGGVALHNTGEKGSMEVIPLAGDESFWGADFLVAYSISQATQTFSLTTLI